MSSANECQSTKYNRQREIAMIMHKRTRLYVCVCMYVIMCIYKHRLITADNNIKGNLNH